MTIRAEIFGGRIEHRLLKEKRPKRSDGKGLADIAIAREETRRTNNRDQDRFRLTGAKFTVTFDSRDVEVELINLSGGGAMIAAEFQPMIGDRLHLRLGDDPASSIECAVRWIKGGRLGLEFAHETQLQCSDDERAALLRDVISRDFPEEKFSGNVVPIKSQEPADPADQREATRHPLIWSGEVHHGSHSWSARLRNISATGALIECPGTLRPDSEVVLDLGRAGALTATVSWAVGDHVGLRFDEPFDMRRLSEARPGVTPPRWLRPKYLEGEVEADSAWDEAWGRVSISELKQQLEGFLKR